MNKLKLNPMNKLKTNMKAIVLSMLLAAAVLPMNTFAQEQGRGHSGGLFGFGNDSNSNGLFANLRGEEEGMGLGDATQENPMEGPIGSGIAILMAAGAGYVLLKRKEDKQ